VDRGLGKTLGFFMIKVDTGKGGGESGKVDKKILNVNIFNFAEVDKGGRKTPIHQKWIISIFLTLS
jgi:hypothetical protein